MTTHEATITSIHPITPHVKQFILEVPGHTFDFQPGQHTQIRIEQPDEDAPVLRPYTPVTLPGTSSIALTIKRYPDGTVSSWMDTRRIGDTVTITDLSGNLYLREPARDAVFFSTGTGITPMMALLKHYLNEGTGNALFVHGERTQDDLIYRETLDHLSTDYASLSVDFVLSDEEWSGRTGFVQEHLNDWSDALDSADIYVCGVPEMVVQTTDALAERGIPEDRIITEGWEAGATE
ncbi:ferredoxin--NADP reductase [Salisaeta longa]|uniref:ferredoxin--NADP reductase n=1 Tax=Salisaeta longa TaxID=503170 RepID=UPI0003B5F558|nr:ferredoxin--NADP reductase [Salisaeta longa]